MVIDIDKVIVMKYITMIKHTLALALLGSLSWHQAGAQTRSLAILETPTDARAASMGGVALMSTDRSYLYVNPGAFFAQDKVLTASASGVLFAKPRDTEGRLMTGTLSAGWRVARRHIVYAGYRYQGGLAYRRVVDQFGTTGKSERPFEWTIDLGYAFKVSDRLSVFGTGSLVQSFTGRGAYGGAFGLGAAYRTDLELGSQDAQLGVVARVADFGTPIYYSRNDSYALPSKAELSADLTTDFSADHRLTVLLGGGCYFLPTDAQVYFGNIGAEYTIFNAVSLRTGYRLGGHSSSFWSCGIGTQYKGVKLDLAYLCGAKDSYANRAMLTLSYDL